MEVRRRKKGKGLKPHNRVARELENTESIDNGFEDILRLSRNCRFSDCTHTTEPDCAVAEAVEKGLLSEERFYQYFRQKNEAMYVSRQRNKTKAMDYMKQLKLFAK